MFDNYKPNNTRGDSSTDWDPEAVNVALPKGDGRCVEGADINVTSTTDYTPVNSIDFLIQKFIEYCNNVDRFT